jgi:hypothetical protein
MELQTTTFMGQRGILVAGVFVPEVTQAFAVFTKPAPALCPRRHDDTTFAAALSEALTLAKQTSRTQYVCYGSVDPAAATRHVASTTAWVAVVAAKDRDVPPPDAPQLDVSRWFYRAVCVAFSDGRVIS